MNDFGVGLTSFTSISFVALDKRLPDFFMEPAMTCAVLLCIGYQNLPDPVFQYLQNINELLNTLLRSNAPQQVLQFVPMESVSRSAVAVATGGNKMDPAMREKVTLKRCRDYVELSSKKTPYSGVDLDQALFQPFPSEIIFQNYAPCEVYEVPLVLRNNDKIPRMVKVVEESSPYFKIISPKDIGHKVAPGVPSIFRILFTPEENKDYAHMLTCITEREKFIVPVKARGARAILDFPDELNFSTCPVKYCTQKILLVQNIGNKDSVFHLKTRRVCDNLSKEEKLETDMFLEECILDPSLRERLSIVSRIFENQRKLVQADSMLFLNHIFTIEPLVLPVKGPGREIRLPLRIRGEGMGPKIHFNFESLDIGKVFVGSTHCYEAVLSNKGSIDALFNVIPPTSALGACFVFNPKEGIIEPSGVQAVQICFSSAILGHFEEEFLIDVNGSPEPVKLTIRISPYFDVFPQ
ncbi:hypothetical protein A6R68_21144 [Neotoma lepida]|uniref:HYDIN/VesB/CFA65-like Ig-like domain-containing protein n=1 Tax=Neotoma lepida TaxID=56216 RepID=A0A1A6HQZ0_NEOLE|nr:hypothetical protein A6R68_21144 [Neotoma lepida]